jgi:transcriptional regulator with XRE-family HTH domain
MNTRTNKLATLLGVGVVLSLGAYTLGTQAGGGGALASGSNASASSSSSSSGSAQSGGKVVFDRGGPGHAGFRRGGAGLDDLATKLGVSRTALENALKAIRDEKTPAQRRTELTQAFATALGKTPDQVSSALDSVLPDKPDRARGDFAAALAKALGVDTAKVQAGLDKARQDFRNGSGNGNRDRRGLRGSIDTVVNDIASATGVDAAKVRSALQSLRPNRPDRRDRGDDIRRKLATALGVTTAQLDAAFKKVATQARDQFATELAQKLNVDSQKVKDALPDFGGFGGFGFGFHRHG